MGNTGKERANRALQAMEELGLDRKVVTPLLRELLKVYNNEWTYIEAENYRLLADQAFEQQETVLNPEPPSGVRQTRASLSASTSATEKGKKQIGYDTRSPQKRPAKEFLNSSVGADKGVSGPPSLVKVKIEEGAEATPETFVRTPFVGRVETRAMRDEQDILRSNRGKLDRQSASTAVPSSATVIIDAETLEETLRQVAKVTTELNTGSRPTVGLSEENVRPQTRKKIDQAEQALEREDTDCGQAVQLPVPDPRLSDATGGCHVLESSAPEPDRDKSREAEPVMAGQPICSNVVHEKSLWHKPVRDEANVLLLLADNYSEDEDELKVVESPVIDSTVGLSSGEERQDEPLPAEAGEPDSSVIQLSSEGYQEQHMESTVIDLPEEVTPEQPLDMVLSIEEEPEQPYTLETHLVPENAVRTAERIRPRFIVSKTEVAADEDPKETSSLRPNELEITLSTAKRNLSSPHESIQVKRIKYDAEPEASPKISNGCIDLHEIDLDSCCVSQDKEKCAGPPVSSKTNLIIAASPSPPNSMKVSVVVGVTMAAVNRRKLVLSESPSPEGSPASKAHSINGITESMKTDACPSQAESGEVEKSLLAPIPVTDKETMTLGSSSMKVAENGASTVMVNTITDPEEFHDEPLDSRKKLAHFPADISRGAERLSIPYVNEYSSDTIPASFKYIPVNTVFQDAYVNFSLARVGEEDCCGGCFGDCLKAPYPCTCTRETGGVFAYTEDGLLKDEFLLYEVDSLQNEELKEKLMTFCQSGWECPIERAKNNSIPEVCKGHVSRKFIKECWHKCGCSMNCGNRVVQRGVTRRLQIFFTQEGKGWGLRTLEQLPAGAFVCEYVGEILTNIELDIRNNAQKGESAGTHTYPILLDGDWCSEKVLKDEEALCLDATNFGNTARFINHRCFDANLIDMPVTIESPDRHYYHVAFFTSRAVKAMEELTWDYKIDFDDHEHPIEAFKCLCRSPFCRGSSGKKHKKFVKKFSHSSAK